MYQILTILLIFISIDISTWLILTNIILCLLSCSVCLYLYCNILRYKNVKYYKDMIN